ncbi:hypothetical protein J0871_16825 [Salegentibacter sp. BDJ18]|uniref:hypothetical protein n=1 Tax=Salegentibacter sp. BDJ18 TaxID=2816376 RepID=UPI001AAF1EF4|nr:hypothetical protein [Salegentibacter sp. BDJ18]MBO2546082.1 hypothetical protein [Salegentibacter sp. BDJ18]
MEFNIQPKQDDPQRLLKLNGVDKAFWLGAEEINLMIRAIKQLLGEDDSLYKGEHPNLEAVTFYHPNPEPGSYAQIEGDPNQEAIWDNSNGKWIISGDWQEPTPAQESINYEENFASFPPEGFEDELYVDKEEAKIYIWDDFEGLYILAAGSGVSQSYVDTEIAKVLAAAKAYTDSFSGGNTSPTIHSFYAAHQQDLDYRVTGYFSFPDATFGSKQNPVVQNLTLSPGDATYDRIDMIVANDQGNFEVIEGVPSENPEEPSIDLDTQIRGTIIFVGANATTPVNQTATTVFAEGTAGEFNTSTPSGAARLNLASANTPISGSISIEGTNNEYNDTVRFTPDATITRETFEAFTGFAYKIKNKTAVATPDYPTHRIQIYGKKSNGSNVIAYLEEVDIYGYDSENLNTQKIAVPFSMPANMAEISYINFKVLYNVDPWGFWLDDVQLIGGEEDPISDDFVTREEMEAAIAEINAVKPPIPKAANYIVEATHHDRDIYADSASEIVVTLPKNSTTPIPVNFETHVWWIGAGKVSFNPVTDVTLNIDETEIAEIARRYNAVTLKKIATDVWIAIGALKLAEV